MLSPASSPNFENDDGVIVSRKSGPCANEFLPDGAHAFLKVWIAPNRSPAEKSPLNFVKLMQQLLEPKLVGLMDSDKKHLVVFRRRGARLLKREQLLQIKIARVVSAAWMQVIHRFRNFALDKR